MTSHSIVLPGQILAASAPDAADFLRGHGTYVERLTSGNANEERLVASVMGTVHRVNKLLHVATASSAARYDGHVGDLVVGRVVTVASTRWNVRLGTSQKTAALPLSGVHLPGGAQRVRTAQDARDMRFYVNEGDLVSAEVHKVQQDGTLFLHTRSVRYGKLENGVLVIVPPSLVPRRKNHYTDLLGFEVLWGCNGYIWIQRKLPEDDSAMETTGAGQELAERQERRRREHAEQPYSIEDRQALARLRNSIECLRMVHALVSSESVEIIYNASGTMPPSQMLLPENVILLTQSTRA
jgi:exosome complex component RRP4